LQPPSIFRSADATTPGLQNCTGNAEGIAQIPGTSDVNIFQEPNYPEVGVNLDRVKAEQAGLSQRDVVGGMLVSLSASDPDVSESVGRHPRNS